MFDRTTPDYYKVLGVSRDASIDEIKRTFRELCKETHPDVSKIKNTASVERFKQISNAASILTNPIKKQQYDAQLHDSSIRFHYNSSSSRRSSSSYYSFFTSSAEEIAQKRAPHHYNQQQHATGFHAILETLFRPRNLFVIGPIILYTSVKTAQFVGSYFFGISKDSHINDNYKKIKSSDVVGGVNSSTSSSSNRHDEMIQAWMNPITKRYETPAPWDPYYQQIQPPLVMVPRNQVIHRTR